MTAEYTRLYFAYSGGIILLLLGIGGCVTDKQVTGDADSGADTSTDADADTDTDADSDADSDADADNDADTDSDADSDGDTDGDADSTDEDDTATEDDTETDTGEAAEVIAEPNDDATYLFSPDEVRTYELRLSKADLAFLNSAPAAEEYVEGELVFEGQTVSPVGIRYKGNAGSYNQCTAMGLGGAHGRKTCPKLSMKVKINWEDPDARFYGLKKLQFHAMNSDDSLMREQLGYYAFRSMGIAAPRTAHVRLLINGTLEGVFLLVEQIDGRFTRSHFTEGGKGNLYKEVWPIHSKPAPYLNALRTNEDEDPSVDRPLALASELTNAAPADRLAVVSYWMDIDYALRYVAVDRIIRHDDGPFHWYCGIKVAQGNNPGTCGNHNYYWYESLDSDRFWIVPWDLDLAFGGNPAVALSGAWNDRNPNCNLSSLMGRRPAACDPLIYTWGGVSESYKQAIEELISGPFSPQVVDELLDQWTAKIDSIVVEAAKLQGHLKRNAWHNAIKDLRNAVNQQRKQISN